MKCKYSSFHKRLSTCDCDGADIIVFDSKSKYVCLTKSTMTLLTKLVLNQRTNFSLYKSLIPSNNLEVVIVKFLLQLMLQVLHLDMTLVHLSMINVE